MEARRYRRELEEQLQTLQMFDETCCDKVKEIVKNLTGERDGLRLEKIQLESERDVLRAENAVLKCHNGNIFILFFFYLHFVGIYSTFFTIFFAYF